MTNLAILVDGTKRQPYGFQTTLNQVIVCFSVCGGGNEVHLL